jgi:hypothetical protein
MDTSWPEWIRAFVRVIVWAGRAAIWCFAGCVIMFIALATPHLGRRTATAD